MPLNHPLLTWGPRQAGTVAGTAFVGMVTGHCWGKRPSADPGLKRAAAHRAPGTHYPVWHCVTLWVCVVRASGNVDVIRVSFFMYFKSSFYFWYVPLPGTVSVIRFEDTACWKGNFSSFFCPGWDDALWRCVQTELQGDFPFTHFTTAVFVLLLYSLHSDKTDNCTNVSFN